MIEAFKITHYFEKQVVLKRLNLSIFPAEIVLLSGRNGSGKTTLLKILSGLIRPREGEIFWKGESIWDELPAYHSKIGFLGHENYLYPDLTVRQNLHLYTGLYGSGRTDFRSGELLETMELERAQDLLVRELSHGMKRKASLIRALLHDPEILFLDEPFSGLDEKGREAVARILRKRKQSGKAAFLTSPEGERPAELPDCRRLELSKGQIVNDALVESESAPF